MRFILWALLIAAPAVAHAQVGSARFDIDSIGDSTVTFAVGNARWVHAGQTGLAVEPRRHDELIARLRIITVSNGSATAVITGQTSRVSEGQVALIRRPAPPFYTVGLFWIGAAVGAVITFAATR
ncbi:MAG TPA: hypothetical protein VFA43_14245 [Gemmatimonadaceae bacterium]|nr:hypothetical protein [Gemmatimonadaceae bacterium]